MNRGAFGLIALTITTAGLVAVVMASACDGDQAGCTVDTDCPQGFICRESICGSVVGDASSPVVDSAPPVTCGAEGATCNAPEECCTRICTSNRCASSTPPPISTCRGSLELCQNDCCVGFTCTAGVCR